ncbi:MAG: YhbY family RNA-binding protein [Candidatus Pacearchaeota archaeon]
MEQIKKFQLGKNGVSENFVEQIKKSFVDTKRIKISVLRSCCRDREELKKIAEKIKNKLGENFDYRIIGFTIVLIKLK